MKDDALDSDCTRAAPIKTDRTEPRPPAISSCHRARRGDAHQRVVNSGGGRTDADLPRENETSDATQQSGQKESQQNLSVDPNADPSCTERIGSYGASRRPSPVRNRTYSNVATMTRMARKQAGIPATVDCVTSER